MKLSQLLELLKDMAVEGVDPYVKIGFNQTIANIAVVSDGDNDTIVIGDKKYAQSIVAGGV